MSRVVSVDRDFMDKRNEFDVDEDDNEDIILEKAKKQRKAQKYGLKVRTKGE